MKFHRRELNFSVKVGSHAIQKVTTPVRIIQDQASSFFMLFFIFLHERETCKVRNKVIDYFLVLECKIEIPIKFFHRIVLQQNCFPHFFSYFFFYCEW